MSQFSPDRKAFTQNILPGLSVFPFCDCELWWCIILILPCADSEVCPLFNAFFPRVRENIWNHCAYVSHTELETRTAQLPSAAKPDFKSERCFKIRIPYLEQCYFPAHTLCWFCFSSLPKKGWLFVPYIILRSKRHTIAYPPFCICSKYRGRQSKKNQNTVKYYKLQWK